MPRREPFDFLIPAARNRSGDDPIFKLNAEARARKQAGESVVNATLGALSDDEGKLAMMPVVSEAFAAIEPARAAGYAPIHGDPAFLRGVIADLFDGSPLKDASVAAATPGGSGALCLAVQTCLEPGQAVLVPDLHWGPYKTMAEQNHRRLETWTLFDAKGGLDLFSFEKQLRALLGAQGRALVFLNFPCNNPTGYSPSPAEWRSIATIAKSASEAGTITLLVDHAYARFAKGGGDDWIAALSSVVPGCLLLVAWTASKSFAQYGARIGALVAAHPDAALRERLAHAFGFGCRGIWSNCNHLGQLAIGSLLNDAALRQRVTRERSVLVDLLSRRVATFNAAAKSAGIAHPRYEGGFFVSVFCRDGKATAEQAKSRGVFVVPQAGSVRVALCSTPESVIPRLVETLAASVE